MNREEELNKTIDEALNLIKKQQVELEKYRYENTKLKLKIKTIGEIIDYD